MFNKTPTEEAAPTPPAPPAALPEEWAEAADPSSGRTFCYHRESGVSSWDRPQVPDDEAEEPLEGGEEPISKEEASAEDGGEV